MRYLIILSSIILLASGCSVTHYLTPEQLGILANSEIYIDALTIGGRKTVAVVIKNPDCKEMDGDYILSLKDWSGVTEEDRFDTGPGHIEYIYPIEADVFTDPIHAVLYQYESKQDRKFVRTRWSGTIQFSEPP